MRGKIPHDGDAVLCEAKHHKLLSPCSKKGTDGVEHTGFSTMPQASEIGDTDRLTVNNTSCCPCSLSVLVLVSFKARH